MEVLIPEGLSRQLEHDAAVGADYGLGVLAVTAKIFEVSAAPYGFHERVEHHHGLGADALAVLIDGTAVCAFVGVADLFAVRSVSLGLVSADIFRYFYSEFVFFVIPFMHISFPRSNQVVYSAIIIDKLLCRK